jgi:hypothetical protein
MAYSNFFSLTHKGAFLVIILSLIAPPCFKFYFNYLLGQSLKRNIDPDFYIFGFIYLFLILVKGSVLGLYLRFSSRNLFK